MLFYYWAFYLYHNKTPFLSLAVINHPTVHHTTTIPR